MTKDFTGGTLSITQLLLDASISGDWSGVSGVSVEQEIIWLLCTNIQKDPVKL